MVESSDTEDRETGAKEDEGAKEKTEKTLHRYVFLFLLACY